MHIEQIAGWVILGLIAGALARLVIPGETKGGWFASMLLGLLGAVVGGWIARESGFSVPMEPGEWIPGVRSIVSATLGAIVILAVWKAITR